MPRKVMVMPASKCSKGINGGSTFHLIGSFMRFKTWMEETGWGVDVQ